MVNKTLLMKEIVGAGYNQKSFSKKIGMNKNTFNSRINGKSDFTTGEVDACCKALNIVDAEMKVLIFLS